MIFHGKLSHYFNHMTTWGKVSLTLVAATTLLMSGCNSLSENKIIKLAHGLNVDHSVHQAMVKLGEDLSQLSNGKMQIKIYPNQQLGTERQCLELLQIGSLDMTKVSSGVMENFAPNIKVFGVPFLFKDRSHSFRVLDGPIGQRLLADGEKYLLKGLGYYDAGSRSFYTKERPVSAPSDLQGMKIRVMESVTAMDMVRAMGGSPTPISWGELYTSLQQGVVDGAENNPPSFYLSRHYEVCKYYSLDEHTVLPDILLAGTRFWNGLTDQERTWLQTAVLNSINYQRELWAAAEAEALEAVQQAGVEIIKPDKAPFVQSVADIYQQYQSDPAMWELIQQIKSVE